MKPNYKLISSSGTNIFTAMIQETERDFKYPWHYHPEYELTFILKGHGVRYIGNSIENFFDDDLVLVGSNLPHCWINTAEQQDSVSAVVVYIKDEFLDKTLMESSEFCAIRRLLSLSNKGIKFDKAVALKLKERCLRLPHLTPFEKMILLFQILQELAQTTRYDFLCEHGFTNNLNDSQNERINVVYRYIEKNYRQKISLADIAAHINMSEEYFSRFFSKIMKKSFIEFLNEYKINKACKLLIETDKQISEICYSSGFESIPFFYRQFKKFKNCQPKHYRASYQKAL